MSEGSNRRLVILLVIGLVILIVLVAIWQWGGFSGDDETAATTTATRAPRVLTEAEKAQIRSLQFATPTATVDRKTPEGQKLEREISNMMDAYKPPPLSTQEREDIIRMTRQNY